MTGGLSGQPLQLCAEFWYFLLWIELMLSGLYHLTLGFFGFFLRILLLLLFS